MPLFQTKAKCGLKVRIFGTQKWSTIYYLLLSISNLELFDNCINHNYNKIVKSDWLSTALISALIGQFNRTVRVMPK